MGCRIKANCQLVGTGPVDEVPSVGVLSNTSQWKINAENCISITARKNF